MSYSLDNIKLSEEGFKKIISFIQEERGIDLNPYRQSFLFRRLRMRMLKTEAWDYLDYMRLLIENSEEFNLFLDNLSINVTEFFRDVDVFDVVRKTVLPEMAARKQAAHQHTIHVWSAGCASGEEPYSIAILIKEALAEKADFVVRIWGTDIDGEVLEKAKKAQYPAKDLSKASPEMLKKYFNLAGNNCYSLKEEIRGMVKFVQRDLISQAPLEFNDIIFCRNVLIYLSRQEQEELFSKFSQALNSKGYLVIGKVETAWNNNVFVPVDRRSKIYQKIS